MTAVLCAMDSVCRRRRRVCECWSRHTIVNLTSGHLEESWSDAQKYKEDSVGRMMAKGEVKMEASMVKAYVCKAAEWVTRESMQIHGGMGYAEEFPVSRLFVDARVLSIFEGADETLCLKVIARQLIANSEA